MKKVICLLLLVSLMVFGCIKPEEKPEKIVIGEIDPLTGRLAKSGMSVHKGVLYAIEEVNSKGGINGRNVTLVYRDDQSKPERAIAAAEELCSKENVVALTGGYVDSLVGPISEIAQKYHVPYVASASLQIALSKRGNEYFFRVSNVKAFINATTGVVLEVFRPKSVAILYSSTPGSTELANHQKEILEKNGVKVSVFEKFRPGTPDFTPLLAKVQQEGVDVLLVNGFFSDNVLMIRQLKESNIDVKAYLGSFTIEDPEFITEMKEDGEYIYGTAGWEKGITTPGTEKLSEEYIEGFKKMFGHEPEALTSHGYASTKAILEAIKRTLDKGLPLTGENIREELTKIDLLLPLERLKFDENGDPMYYTRVVFQIQNGTHVVIYPKERATGNAIYPMPRWSERM